MDKNSFVQQYVAAFLAARAERFYAESAAIRNPDYSWMYKQPVNDARELAEEAWLSLKQQAPLSSSGTIGNAVTVTTGTDSIPTISSTPESVDPTNSGTF